MTNETLTRLAQLAAYFDEQATAVERSLALFDKLDARGAQGQEKRAVARARLTGMRDAWQLAAESVRETMAEG